MNRTTLIIIGVAALAATIAAAAAHGQTVASGERDYGHADTTYPSSYGRPTDDWGDSGYETPARTAQLAKAPAPAASTPRAFTTQDWLDELDRRVGRQEAALDTTLTRTQYFVAGLMLLIGGSIAYLWVCLAQMAAKCDRLQACLESPVDAQPGKAASTVAATAPSAAGRTDAAAPTRPMMGAGVPRVQVLAGLIDRLVAGINESRRRRGDVETGYALVGKITDDGASRIITVSGLIDEGPNAARSGGHHKADRTYQQDELCLLQLADPDLMHIGDAHLHPGSMDTCSGGDHRTDTGNVRASRSQEMVFVIATAASSHWGGQSEGGLCHAGLKLNFYYLGKASGYEYRRFRPEVVEGEALSASEPLRRFIEADPVRARLDFDNLRRLTDYTMTVSELPGEDGTRRPCIEMTHKTRGFRTLIAFSGDPRKRPEVLVDTGAQMAQFQPAYLNGGWTSVVWFTPIVLDIERELTGRHSAAAGKDTATPAGGRSAHAGAEVPGPRIGDSHGKLSAIEQGPGRTDPSGDVPQPVRK